jgi:hypothetical protein
MKLRLLAGTALAAFALTTTAPALADTPPPTKVQAQPTGWVGMSVKPRNIQFGQGGKPFMTNLTWAWWHTSNAWASGKLWTIKPNCFPLSNCTYNSWKAAVYLYTVKVHGSLHYFYNMAVRFYRRRMAPAGGHVQDPAGCEGAVLGLPERLALPMRSFQKGRNASDFDFYSYPGMNVTAFARQDVAYARSLHANAMSVSFPFFMSGPASTRVHATSSSPSPAALAVLARYAEAAELYFSLRPLLDEHSLGGPFRTFWKPPRLAAWFGSYERFLEPYAKMAQRARVPEFITGAELSNFWRSPYWDRLDTVLRREFKGRLAYCNNWSDHLTRATNGMGVLAMVDAYRPMHVPGNAGVVRLTAAWDGYARRLPRGVVLSEVGIAAQPEPTPGRTW